jgi:hypothetical protein
MNIEYLPQENLFRLLRSKLHTGNLLNILLEVARLIFNEIKICWNSWNNRHYVNTHKAHCSDTKMQKKKPALSHSISYTLLYKRNNMYKTVSTFVETFRDFFNTVLKDEYKRIN